MRQKTFFKNILNIVGYAVLYFIVLYSTYATLKESAIIFAFPITYLLVMGYKAWVAKIRGQLPDNF